MPKKKQSRPCLCGCGQETKGGYVLPGHDKRFHDHPEQADIATLMDVAQWKAEHPKPVKVKAPANPEKRRPCDSVCEYAIGEVCACKCGGVNHGKGWEAFFDLLGMEGAGKISKRELKAEAKRTLKDHARASQLEQEEELEEEIA